MGATYGKICVGVPTGERPRHVDFYNHYNALDRPAGTVCKFSHGQSPAKNRNDIIDTALEHDCSHILFLDDDMTFAPDILMKLLENADKDVVTGLYLLRNFPHYPVIFDKHYPDGKCKFCFLEHQQGLHEIVNCGFGCVLMRTEIFKTIPKPWITLGGIIADEWCDDVFFFNKVKEYGFRIFCDFSVVLGHKLELTLTPNFDGKKWQTLYVTNTQNAVGIPQAVPTREELEKIELECYGVN